MARQTKKNRHRSALRLVKSTRRTDDSFSQVCGCGAVIKQCQFGPYCSSKGRDCPELPEAAKTQQLPIPVEGFNQAEMARRAVRRLRGQTFLEQRRLANRSYI